MPVSAGRLLAQLDSLTQSFDRLSGVLPSRDVDFCFHGLEADHHLVRRLDYLTNPAFDLPNTGRADMDGRYLRSPVSRRLFSALTSDGPMAFLYNTISSNIPALPPAASSSLWANYSRRSTFSLDTVTLHGTRGSKGDTVLPRSLAGSSLSPSLYGGFVGNRDFRECTRANRTNESYLIERPE